MRELGWNNPVLVDEDGRLIAGHGRLLAARQPGLTEAPVMVARGWSEAQKRAYLIADNQIALNAGWDEALLTSELSGLREMDFALDLMGFGSEELERLLTLDDLSTGARGRWLGPGVGLPRGCRLATQTTCGCAGRIA